MSKKTVLIFCADAINARVFTRHFNRLGWEATVTYDELSALALYNQDHHKVVVANVDFTVKLGRDGLGLVLDIRRLGGVQPHFILSSASFGPTAEDLIKRLQPSAILEQPFLIMSIKKILNGLNLGDDQTVLTEEERRVEKGLSAVPV